MPKRRPSGVSHRGKRYVNALVDRTGRIAAIDRKLRNQCVCKRMRQQIPRTKLIAHSAIGNILSTPAALLEPTISACA
jgi:hypothetical protein